MRSMYRLIPQIQTAIVQGPGGRLQILQDVPLPSLMPHEVLVETIAVALNPTDYKVAAKFPSPRSIAGCDFTGIVVLVGSAVTRLNSGIEVGDRVCGVVQGNNPLDQQAGAFAEFLKAPANFVCKVPEWMPWENAAAIGAVGHGTMGLALFDSLGLEATPVRPSVKEVPVLVYGGSTASGTMAIQLLKLAGLKPITTCSPKNFALVKSFGAEEVFDYSSPTCADDIRACTNNKLRYVVDCITDTESVRICYAAIGRSGGAIYLFRVLPRASQNTEGREV